MHGTVTSPGIAESNAANDAGNHNSDDDSQYNADHNTEEIPTGRGWNVNKEGPSLGDTMTKDNYYWKGNTVQREILEGILFSLYLLSYVESQNQSTMNMINTYVSRAPECTFPATVQI